MWFQNWGSLEMQPVKGGRTACRCHENGAKTESVTICSQAGCIVQQAVREKQHQQLLTWMNVKTTATSFVTFLMHP